MKNLLIAFGVGVVVAVIWISKRDSKRAGFKTAQAAGGVRA